MNSAGKIYFMGFWYRPDDIRSGLLKATRLSEDDIDWDELSETMENIAKTSPTVYSRFSREMHNIRFGRK